MANEGQGEGAHNMAPGMTKDMDKMEIDSLILLPFFTDLDEDSDKNRTETPPPSYDEALAISSNNPDNLFVNLPPAEGAVALPLPSELDDRPPAASPPPPAITTADIPVAGPSNSRLTGTAGRPFDV